MLTALLAAGSFGCANSSRSSTAPASSSGSAQVEKVGSAAGALPTIAEFQPAAARHRAVLELPEFERTPALVVTEVDRVLREADAELTDLGAQSPTTATFNSTIARIDDIIYPVVTAMYEMELLKETNTNAKMRETASEQYTRIQQWFVALEYREDVYKACKAFEEAYNEQRRPRLRGEDQKLFAETMRDYRRAGMHLNAATRRRVEELKKHVAALETEFSKNVTDAKAVLTFSIDEMQGVPESFLNRVRTPDENFAININVTPEVIAVLSNADSEDVRRRVETARYQLAMDVNTTLLDEIVRMRAEIADLLGYDSWNDYQIEPKMAKTGERALTFLEELKEGLEPKFRHELDQMRAIKIADTGDPNAQIQGWDWRYYENRIKKDRYSVDTEALRVFFPYEQTLAGMFDVYENIFGLEFQQIQAPNGWAPGVTLYVAIDSETGEPMGAFYLDMFPREGKYGHFAQFGIIEGKELPDGKYQRPVVALVCNFTPATKDTPSLLSHDEVETLFHEFGHCLHSILTRARHVRFSGTNVPRDFVEAPSQMLENWIWDTTVLNRFAADYRDSSKKIDPGVLARMEEARLATIGVYYRRQLAFGISDLRLHGPGEYKNSRDIMNETMTEVFLPPPPDTNFAAYFNHLMGYDAGYYGYAWADAIAADMATRFEKAPGRYMDKNVGMSLRKEIYATGGSREAEESIQAFLGRERSNDPFLKSLGIDRN